MATSPSPQTAPTSITDQPEVRIISHSSLFYWWPIWVLAFFMAVWTLIEDRRMAIVPASMRTVAALAAGLELTLVDRAAAVTLKERRPLVVMPRETPLTRIQIENLLRLHDAGAVILPAEPAFWERLPISKNRRMLIRIISSQYPRLLRPGAIVIGCSPCFQECRRPLARFRRDSIFPSGSLLSAES